MKSEKEKQSVFGKFYLGGSNLILDTFNFYEGSPRA